MNTFKSWPALTARLLARLALLMGTAVSTMVTAATPINLNDNPIFAVASVPGNMALTLSVEYPTAISVANLGDYGDATTYQGYFDPSKCYNYVYNSSTPASSYFAPASRSAGTNGHTCSGQWSGNFMNWAAMQTIDPFRWALSGGYRSVDTTSQTIIEKAWGSAQGSASQNFPYRGTGQGTGNKLATALVTGVTPFSNWTGFNSAIWSNGNAMGFSGSGVLYTAASALLTDYTGSGGVNQVSQQGLGYKVYIRVLVCDTGVSLEANCVKYGNNYKPEGLMQQYSNQIRYSMFSYLNGSGFARQGGVLRRPMDYIGPTYPVPLSTVPTANARKEWDARTGIQYANPDTGSASASGVSQSGVLNYLNGFGENTKNYMTYDNVGELYYAAVRYFENLGNVTSWSNAPTTVELDNFPAVASWTDPILYKCQKNFILGIGDDHTWYDYNVGGGTLTNAGRPKPAQVSSDSINQAHNWTAALQTLEGITPNDTWPFDTGATYYIAGLAYGVHVNDIRSDLDTVQTISTYWMDVMENQRAENLNPYYLAAKYGGFTVPTGYTTANTTPLALGAYDTSGTNINMNGSSHPSPDNYFLAGNATQMVASLKTAFTSIATSIKAYTSAFAFSTPNVVATGTASYSSQYDSSTWTGTVTGATVTFAADGSATSTPVWSSDTTMATQFAGTGWQTGGAVNRTRNIATWNGTTGVPFQAGSLTVAQQGALLPSSYASTVTTNDYVNYLRGDRTNEVGSTATGSKLSLRARTLLLGDIVDALLTPVGVPNQVFSESANPGYANFKLANASRIQMVYAAANDGMVHGFIGSSGIEQFAYIPSDTIQGPSGTPQVDGLAQLGNPNYNHHFYVDSTPVAFDVDFGHTGGTVTAPDWHTMLIGGLGKGGHSFYGLDVSSPASTTTETTLASNVKWEFTDSTMGFSYGAPVVVKTAEYGWVAIFTSGYNNSDGIGYLYIVNPKTGALLQRIATPSTAPGMTQASAYVNDFSDYTADSVYVGDLNGQLWRFDLTGLGTYPSPTLVATLKDAGGNAQPITTAPEIQIHPTTRARFVMVGTGILLSSTDINSSALQSFYAIIDGGSGGFSTITTPLTRADLTPIADLTVGITLPPASKGWYVDFDSSGGIGWRVVVNPSSFNGIVAFSTLLTVGDACKPSGSSRIYAINYLTGKSVLTSTNTGTGTVVAYATVAGAVNDVRIVNNNGSAEVLASDDHGNVSNYNLNGAGVSATRLLNWRELPTPD